MMEKRQQAISKSDDYERAENINSLKKKIDDKLTELTEKKKVISMLEFKANEIQTETIDTENRNQMQSLEFINGLSTEEAQRMLNTKKLDLAKIENDLSDLTKQLIKLEGK